MIGIVRIISRMSLALVRVWPSMWSDIETRHNQIVYRGTQTMQRCCHLYCMTVNKTVNSFNGSKTTIFSYVQCHKLYCDQLFTNNPLTITRLLCTNCWTKGNFANCVIKTYIYLISRPPTWSVESLQWYRCLCCRN